MPYDLNDLDVPRISGTPLKLVAALLEKNKIGSLLRRKIMNDMGFESFERAKLQDSPTYFPSHPSSEQNSAPSNLDLQSLAHQSAPPLDHPFRFWSIVDYAQAYRNKTTTPLVVARRIIDAIAQSDSLNPPLRAISALNTEDLLQQAQESSQRFESQNPRGLLDGVPIAIKDEINQIGYPTSVGTSFLGTNEEQTDATVVTRLRKAGALLIGKANMHEIGIGVTGMNPHHGHARNPYNPECITGGSSSGSAASVAAGLCPVAIGADGGGSIRIPAGLCGVVGLKGTFGRISEFGAYPLCWSVAHVGPIAATIQDAALAYAVIAGKDPNDSLSQQQPPVRIDGLADMDLSGIRVGIFEAWFEHAEPTIVGKCREAIESLLRRGATLVAIEDIPNLNLMRIAHGITIATEMATSLETHYQNRRAEFGLDVRINLAVARHFKSSQYVKAQQVRTLAIHSFNDLFEKVDVVVTPTTGCTASKILPDAVPHGESDLSLLTKIMRYMFVANLTGIPGLSVPVGYDPNGLPIGFQLMGRPFEEHLLLRLGRAIEQDVIRQKPQVFFDILRD